MHSQSQWIRSAWIGAGWLWLCLSSLAAPAATQAEPTLRVRAQVTLDLRVSGRERELRLEGSLTDDLGARLSHRPVHAAFRGPGTASLSAGVRNQELRTDSRGQFALSAPCVGCSVRVEFSGDHFYEHASATQIVAAPRPTIRLDFLEPSDLAVSLDQPSTGFVVRASGQAPVAQLPVELLNELARPIGRGETGPDGVLRVRVAAQQLGPFGLGEIVARVPASPEHAAARVSKAILRTTQTETDLRAELDAKRKSLAVSVLLRTAAHPVAQRAIGIYFDKQHVGTLISDEQGDASAEFALDDTQLSAGKHSVQASFQSDIPGLLSSESKVQAIEVREPERLSSAWLLIPVLASLIFVLWSARRRPAHTAHAQASPLVGPAVRLGADARGQKIPQSTIAGRVEDVDTGHGLNAAIELTRQDQLVQSIQTGADGGFQSDALPPGDYRARVLAPGYAGLEFTFALPHYGACSGLQISARSLRVLALDTYGSFVARMLPDARMRGKTVRETASAAVSGGRNLPGVAELARSTEALAYARAIPYEGDLNELQRAAADALREVGAREPATGDPDLGW